jgi:hypothetical protein
LPFTQLGWHSGVEQRASVQSVSLHAQNCGEVQLPPCRQPVVQASFAVTSVVFANSHTGDVQRGSCQDDVHSHTPGEVQEPPFWQGG